MFRGCKKLELQYWILGYYPNSNAKPRGNKLKAKVQSLVLWTFCKHLCGLTYIDSTIHKIYITHNTQQSHQNKHTHKHTYLQITINILAHAYIYTYIIS